MRTTLMIFLLMISYLPSLSAQSALSKGNQARAAGEYARAVNYYKAARLDAEDNEMIAKINSLIDDSNKKQIESLQKQTNLAKEAAKNAKAAQIIAEQEKETAKQERARAEAAVKLSEARRLSDLAKNEIAKYNFEEALFLAYEAQKKVIALDTIIAQINLAFGDAVYHAYRKKTGKHKNTITILQTAPDGSTFLSVGRDSVVMLWDKTGKFIKKLTPPEDSTLKTHKDLILNVSYTANSQHILTCSADGTAIVWNTKNGALKTFYRGHKGQILGGIFSKDNKKVLTWSRDNTAHLWTLSGEMKANMQHAGNIFDAYFSPDEQQILTRSADKSVKIWDLKGTELALLRNNEAYIYQAAFSQDGNHIITCGGKQAILWTKKGTEIKRLAHPKIVTNAVFSRDGTKILTYGQDHFVKLWSAGGDFLQNFNHSKSITSAVFSTDNNFILTTSKDHTAILWDIKKRTAIQTFFHNTPILKGQLSATAPIILTYGNNGMTKIWSVEGHLLQSFPHKVIHSPSFSTDGQHVLTSADGQTVERIALSTVILQQLQKEHLLLPPLSEKKMEEYGVEKK